MFCGFEGIVVCVSFSTLGVEASGGDRGIKAEGLCRSPAQPLALLPKMRQLAVECLVAGWIQNRGGKKRDCQTILYVSLFAGWYAETLRFLKRLAWRKARPLVSVCACVSVHARCQKHSRNSWAWKNLFLHSDRWTDRGGGEEERAAPHLPLRTFIAVSSRPDAKS